MLGSTFYHETMRKCVVGFGTLFNDIHITRKDSSGNVIQSIKVSDVLGKEIFMVSSLNSDTFTLNTSNFQTGVYLITINDNVTKKLIIE